MTLTTTRMKSIKHPSEAAGFAEAEPAVERKVSMNIHLAGAAGFADTELAAFDQALYKTGTANRNLIYLSSVIPPFARLAIHEAGIPEEEMPGEWGDRLYVVRAERRLAVPGEIWAGIGWKQDPETGKGLFVEHDGLSEEAVARSIRKSLEGLMTTRGYDPDMWPTDMLLQGAESDGRTAASTLVIAAYQNSGWDNTAHLMG